MIPGIVELCARGKRAGKPRTDETGGAGDDDLHAATGGAMRPGIGGADLI
jgi:hypothetical protein